MGYAYIKDEKIIGHGRCSISNEEMSVVEVSEEIYNNIDHYIYSNGEIVLNPNWEEEEYKKQRTEEILAELQEIDNKSIRSIRTNDTEYIQLYETQAQALREELRGLNDNK